MTKNDIYVVTATKEVGNDYYETNYCLYHRNDDGEYDKLLSNSGMNAYSYYWDGKPE